MLDEKIVESLVASFESRLRGLIEHAASVEPMWTPSDFPLLRSMLGDHELEARGLASSDIADLYPATPMQAGLLFHSVLEANRGLYIYQLRLTLAGPFEIENWRGTWQAAIDRHDLLRTGFIWSDRGDALQVVRRTVGVPLEVDDWSTTDASGFEARLSSWLAEDRARGFELDGPTLMRLHVFRRPDGHVDVVWTMHHAVSDGWSSARLLDEVFRDFLARRTGNRAALRSAPRYRDYVAWLRNQPSSESFWRARLASVDDPATLGTFLSRSAATEAHWRELSIRRDHTWLERLNVAARRQRVTPATLVQSAWALLLARYADRRQVVFGVTVAGRPAELPDADRMTGLFINSLPLWLDVPDAERTGEWLRTVQHQSSDLQQHGHVPLSSIQKWAGRPGEALFDSLVVIENYPVDAKTLQDAEIKLLDVQVSSRTHYPLSLTVTLREELELLWEWDLTRVDATAVGRITEHYCEILHALTADGVDELRLEEIRPRPATPALRAPAAGAAFRSVSQRISDNARLHPDAEAVRCDGASVSYGELETWSRAVASHLRARGVQRDERIGVCVERSPALVAALLGAWRAGAAYVPLDPTYPALRLRAMIDDAEIDTVLADDSSIERLSD
ncbi:MAG TPA: condensation domain-containing protein, partial [Polyangiaceae bacterium]